MRISDWSSDVCSSDLQSTVLGINLKGKMLRWVAQIAIDQQRTFCFVERHRGSQIAGNEATATATADRRHQRNEIAVTHGQKLGPQLEECIHKIGRANV